MYPAHFITGEGRPTSRASRTRLKRTVRMGGLLKTPFKKEERVTLPRPCVPARSMSRKPTDCTKTVLAR